MRGASAASWWLVSAAWIGGLAALLCLMIFEQPELVYESGAASAAADGREDLAQIQASLEAWKRLWTQLEAEGVATLSPEVRIAGARYAGDTCGMRYRRLYRGIDGEARERLVIAAFANDPEIKQQVLEPLTGSPDTRVRARAAAELARVALRRGDTGAAEGALQRAKGLDLPPACQADIHYLEGRIAVHRSETSAALTAFAVANTLDPGFWNAYRDRLPVLVHALHDPDQHVAACVDRARVLIEVLGLLPQLARDTRQFAKLALSLERLGVRSSATLLASGMMWRWAGEEAYGRTVLARGREAPELLPPACEREMRERIDLLLEEL